MELRLEFKLDIKALRGIFNEYLDETQFILINDEEDVDGGFRMLGVNKTKSSLLSSVMTSLIGGFIPRNRMALELIAHRRDDLLITILRCVPYMDNADLETTPQSPQERKRCEEMARDLEKKILERVSVGSVAGPGARGKNTREQEPAWPSFEKGKGMPLSLQRFPDIQDPKTPLGP